MRISRAIGRCSRLSRHTIRDRSLSVCLILAGAAVWPASAPAAVSDAQIQRSVALAVQYLKGVVLSPTDGGRQSLVALALLKGGVSPETPELKTALERIAKRINAQGVFDVSTHHVYDAGVTLMALANAEPQKYKREIDALTEYLIKYQGPEGDWDYMMRTAGDTSITQYAVLGLWEASRSGAKVPIRVWDKAARWHITRQQRDGGFAYHPPGPVAAGYSASPSHTMTVAGSASLLVARLHLSGDPAALLPELEESSAAGKKSNRKKYGFLVPSRHDVDELDSNNAPAGPDGPVTTRLTTLDRSVANGRRWLTNQFTVRPDTGWKIYYLYGLERFASLAGAKEFGGHDWYDEGAEFLVQNQGFAGNWEDQCGPAAATSFGVMFLVRATEKMLNRPNRRDPRFGGGLLVGGRGLPDNLADVQLDKGAIRPRKLKGAVDELLKELENVQSESVESAQSSLVDTISTENPEALIGQTDRLLRLARDKRVEVRRTALWGLGRSNDLRIVPVLLNGLLDPDLSCVVESHNALRYISKRLSVADLPEDPTAAQRAQNVAMWKKWYQSVRPYDERDDLFEGVKP